MKMNSLKFLGLSAVPLISSVAVPGQKMQQPNIVLFMVDDMGWQDTSEPFWSQLTPYNKLCRTPNMERLARQGVKFTSAYACAVSSPTRTSLMTGMNAARHRVTNWTLNLNTSTDVSDPELAFPSWNVNGLQPADSTPIVSNGVYATSLTQILKDNGYYTIHAGKAHWGAKTTPGSNPLNLGFDVNIAGSEIGGPASYYGTENFGNGAFHITGLDEFYGSDIFLTEALTRKSIEALNSRPVDKPFYLYLSHYAIHIPIQNDSRFAANYANQSLSAKEISYLTMIEGMDKSLGDLLDYLQKNNLTDNTVVIFMSDNGGHSSVGNVTLNDVRYPHNYPLKGSKGSVYEGGIREPMIVKWPGITKANSTCDRPVIIEDFFPSILEMSGIHHFKTVQKLDGLSFVPVLRGEVGRHKNRKMYWHFPNRWGENAIGSSCYSAVRFGDYKLIYRWHAKLLELYNIKADIGESKNLVWDNKKLTYSLAGMLGKYLRKVDAQRPVDKATGLPVAWPDEVKIQSVPVIP
jgi:arylsulfatase A-like enzyme